MSAGAKPVTAPADLSLPYGRPTIEEDDIRSVVEVLRSSWLTSGPTVERFEHALADAVGAPEAVVCANGTAALHLAALALGLGPGDQVIVPAMTFAATANAARFVGAEVIFSDVDPTTGLMRPEDLGQALGRADRAKAVFPVHLNGQCVPMIELGAIAQAKGLCVVEDACHALGSRTFARGRQFRAGDCAVGDLTAFSFHPVKTVAMGEGGAVTLKDSALAKRLRRLRSHGIERDASGFLDVDLAVDSQGRANPWYTEMQELGFNYRASDIQCALGLSQLAKLGRFAQIRRSLVESYDELIRDLAPVVTPIGRLVDQHPCWHLYVVQIDFEGLGRDRSHVMRSMAQRGIGTQVHYIPVPSHPYYRGLAGNSSKERFPGAWTYYSRSLSLPLFVGMTKSDIHEVVDALVDALGL